MPGIAVARRMLWMAAGEPGGRGGRVFLEFTGEAVVCGTPAAVWRALRDDAVVPRLLPAAREMRRTAPGAYEGPLLVGRTPLVRRHPARVQISGDPLAFSVWVQGTERDDPLTIRVACTLAMDGQGTRLRYRVTAELGPLGRLLGGGATQRLIAEFFRELEAVLQAGSC